MLEFIMFYLNDLISSNGYYNRILFNESHAKECDVDVIKWISSSMYEGHSKNT